MSADIDISFGNHNWIKLVQLIVFNLVAAQLNRLCRTIMDKQCNLYGSSQKYEFGVDKYCSVMFVTVSNLRGLGAE